MVKFFSCVVLDHLEAFRCWLRSAARGWDIALPNEEVVEAGKEYPPFMLYQHGMPVGLVESPFEALEKIGNRTLLEEYLRSVSEDPDT
ncbi:MAG TPA: hypothetical protein VFF81_11715 [Noviherbaspirillum sp.]|nr:hypothetical protein [Noviherbaspirillum sp.]